MPLLPREGHSLVGTPLYDNPKTILQQKLKETLTPVSTTVVSDLIKLSLMKVAEKDENLLVYAEIYKLLGPEKFTELIALIDGSTLSFPSKEEFEETVTTVLCYYYRDIEKKEWPEIKALLGDPDLNTIKFGIRATAFASFINTMIARSVYG